MPPKTHSAILVRFWNIRVTRSYLENKHRSTMFLTDIGNITSVSPGFFDDCFF